MMKHRHTFWDRTVDEFPSGAMGMECLVDSAAFVDDPISVFVGSTDPDSASVLVGRRYVPVKSFFERSPKILLETFLGAIVAAIVPSAMKMDRELLSAKPAHSIDAIFPVDFLSAFPGTEKSLSTSDSVLVHVELLLTYLTYSFFRAADFPETDAETCLRAESPLTTLYEESINFERIPANFAGAINFARLVGSHGGHLPFQGVSLGQDWAGS